MVAASSSLSPCTAAPRSPCLQRHELLRRLPSLPQIRIPRSPQPPRSISASYASPAAERHRENSGAYYNYYSQSRSGGGGSRAGEPAGALSAAGSLYDVLGVSGRATPQEIKAAFRRLARERHPDVAAAGSKGASAEEFMRIHAAYSTLSDPEKRAEYDRRMTASAPQRGPPFFSSSSSAAAASSYYYRPASVDSASSPTFARTPLLPPPSRGGHGRRISAGRIRSTEIRYHVLPQPIETKTRGLRSRRERVFSSQIGPDRSRDRAIYIPHLESDFLAGDGEDGGGWKHRRTVVVAAAAAWRAKRSETESEHGTLRR